MTRSRIWTARGIAAAADLLQIFVFPLFAGGAISPFDDLLDLMVSGVLIGLLGWHWAFVPTIAAELLPILDLFPTWTMAVLFVTAGKGGPGHDSPPERKPPKAVDPIPDREPPLLPPP